MNPTRLRRDVGPVVCEAIAISFFLFFSFRLDVFFFIAENRSGNYRLEKTNGFCVIDLIGVHGCSMFLLMHMANGVRRKGGGSKGDWGRGIGGRRERWGG